MPRADDNCYIKRYHFIEGLATYWRGVEIHPTSKVSGYPEIERLVELMGRYKSDVVVHEHDHRYHFGTHGKVSVDRAVVTEYLVVGT